MTRILAACVCVLGILGAAASCVVFPAPEHEALRALLIVPALLMLPGLAWARGAIHPIDRVLRASVLSTAFGIPLLAAAAQTPAPQPVILFGSALFGALGWLLPGRRLQRGSTGERIGTATVILATALVALTWRTAIELPLDGNWWSPAGESLPEQGTAEPGDGWRTTRQVGAAWVLKPGDGEATFTMGAGLVAVRGPVGTHVTVDGRSAAIEADPMENPEEGPVPRYLGRGVTSSLVEHGGALHLSAPGTTTVYLVPSAQALWELHGSGELRFGHYYQILNMVEQLRWARETGSSRWVTDVQPPLWSWPLGLVLRGNTADGSLGEQPTANVLFLYLCALIGLVAVRAISRWAPNAPWIAYTLPALALAEHARLMLEPGSAGLPDTLYTLAVVALVASPAGAGWGIVAQLARYPGTLISGLFLLYSGRFRDAARLGVSVGILVLAFALVGQASGALEGWIATATWETGPEHWHGETDPTVLLGRAPEFYRVWLGYAGLAPLIALSGWNRAVRVLFGTAVTYSLLLCTIDHFPSHYFLPLLWLSVIAVAAAKPGPWALRTWLALAGLGYALIYVPITG